MSKARQTPNPADHSPAHDVWAEQARISRQLMAWSIASIGAGAALALTGHAAGNRTLRAFGGQNAAWGAVDLAIAGFGEIRRRGRLATVEDPLDPDLQRAEWRSLRRILLLNAGLDVGYIAAGLAGVAWGLRQPDRPLPALVGHSAAVVVQGGFLLVFDTVHARRGHEALSRRSA